MSDTPTEKPKKSTAKRAKTDAPEDDNAKRINRPHSLARSMQRVVGPSMKRFGFAKADLLMHWTEIAGSDIARLAQPMRLSRPRGKADQTGGTLTLKIVGAAAPEIDHRRPHLIERINQFYGFEAVTNLKLVHGLASRQPPPRRPFRTPNQPIPAAQRSALNQKVESVASSELRESLLSLGERILSGDNTDSLPPQKRGTRT